MKRKNHREYFPRYFHPSNMGSLHEITALLRHS